MLVAEHKKFSDKIVPIWLLKLLHKIGLNGNRLTLLSMLSTVVAFYFFWKGELLWGGVAAGMDWIFDFLDGKIARMYQEESKLGSFYDFVSDRLRMSWLLGLAFSSIISFELAIIVLFIEAMLHLTSYYIELKGLKNIKWLPHNIHLLTIGALINQVVLVLQIKVIIGVILLATQVFSTIILNWKKNN